MVDRRHRPGGHWNDAYPFVRLHQPSATYGVNSRELGSWIKDEIGLNAGFYGLASGLEVLNHFDQVMRERFLPSGRVRWLPMSEYRAGPSGTHEITSLINGDVAQIVPRKKLVDATHAQTAVPSTHPSKYAVAAGVKCIPPNRLPEIDGRMRPTPWSARERPAWIVALAHRERRAAVVHPLDHAT